MSASHRDDMNGRDDCPTLEEVLGAEDGLLPLTRQLRVVAHIARCKTCRAEVQERRALGEILGDEDDVAVTDDMEISASSRAVFLQRLYAEERAFVRAASMPQRRWTVAAVLIAVVTAAALLTRPQTTVVHADELLSRVAAEEAVTRPGTIQRIRYQLRPAGIERLDAPQRFALIRDVQHGADGNDDAATGAAAAPAILTRALDAYGFNWRRPLSVASVRRWRAGLSRGRDDVVPIREGLLRLRTRTAEGMLRVVEVVVRQDTTHVVSQALVFEGVGRLEIEELSVSVAHDTSRPTTSGPPTAAAVDERLILAEIEARLIVQRMALDVEGVQISRVGDGIRVEGRVSSAGERRAALSQLGQIDGVDTDLRVSPVAAPTVVVPSESGLARWLDGAYGARPGRERFVPDLTRLATAIPRRIAVLQTLARRYPAPETASMSAAARGKLRLLIEQQYAALRAEMFALRAQLAAPFGTTPAGPSRASAPPDWRARASRAVPQAKALEALIAEVMPQAQDIGTASTAINAAFDALWDTTVGQGQ